MSRNRFRLSVSVFLILKKHDQILFIKRANTGWMDGYWSVPAGAIDGNETLRDAVIREATEEVDIEVKRQDLKLVHTMHCFTHGDEWLGQFFVCENWNGTEKVNEPNKHSEIIWTADINSLKLIPYVKQAFEQIQKGANYSSYKDS